MKLKVHVEKNLFIESDERQFILKEYTGKQDKIGNEQFKVHGYFTSVQQAFKKFATMKIKQSTATTLSELVKDVERIEKYIESKLTV